ncbi:DUF4214 domain-containing protein [Aquimarina algicola]|uniref:DUF4214 domain-containing protein n=1 Tax=Aquimarina algicola TaxID=2589995 RepID=A0A504J1B7_9FLAO|nr:DUF4214 domain-containing protein [Aquimarina algicola]TPN84646.1 DUF4214 domain-containing protein [Aquimarina algicola]
MKFNKIVNCFSILLALFISSCSNEVFDEVTPPSNEGIDSELHSDDPHGEIIEFSDQSENLKFFVGESTKIDPTNTFQGAEIILSTTSDLQSIEYQIQSIDGVWSEWEPILYEGIQEGYYSVHLNIDNNKHYKNLKFKNLKDVQYAKFLFTGIPGEHMVKSKSVSGGKAPINGRWNPPAHIRAIGDNQSISFTQDSGACSGGLLNGTNILRRALRDRFPQIFLAGGYCCRAIGGNGCLSGRPTPAGTPSQHSYGRAVDLHIRTVGGQADNGAGDPVAHWLIENASAIGIQFIIWDRSTWRADRPRGSKVRNYGGPNPHVDHLHIELSRAGSRGQTPWFTGGGDTNSPVGPFPNREDFVTQLYIDIFKRIPNETDLKNWVNKLRSGNISKNGLITLLVNSQEARNVSGIPGESPENFLRRIFKLMLKRSIGEQSIPGWMNSTNRDKNKISAAIFDSIEYRNHFGKYRPFSSSTAFVKAQFKNILKREAESNNPFISQLNAGRSVRDVLFDIVNSQESINRYGTDPVIRAHRAILQRDPIGIHHIHWQRIFDEQGHTGLLNGLFNSNEYRLQFGQ